MPRIDGSAGSIPVGSIGSKASDNSAATVQMGESKLSEVAQRLGVDANSLQNANPQITDPMKLKVGQEVNLPPLQAQTLKEQDGPALQPASSQSGLPPAPLGDPLAKNAMQARLSATDLAQVPGGAQQGNSSHMKFEGKVVNSDAFKGTDKWSKADKPLEADKIIGADKRFQKADDLAQVAGGAKVIDLQQMKEAGKVIHSGQWKDAAKLVDANKTLKMDKNTGAEKTFGKIDEATKIFETTQDVTLNKAKVASKAFEKMDDYIRQ